MAMSNIEAAVGGRAALVTALSTAELSDQQQAFLAKLADPARERQSLQSICTEDGIMFSELLLLLKDAAVAESMVAAMRIGAEALPSVMQDIAKKSVDRVVKCRPCKGTGKLTDGKECMACYGQGKQHVESSLEKQKLLGDWMGLGPKKSGVHVNVGVNQQVGVTLPGGAFSRLVRDTDSPAYDVTPLKEIAHGRESGSTASETDATTEGPAE